MLEFFMAVMVAGFFLGLPVNAIIISVGGATLLRLMRFESQLEQVVRFFDCVRIRIFFQLIVRIRVCHGLCAGGEWQRTSHI